MSAQIEPKEDGTLTVTITGLSQSDLVILRGLCYINPRMVVVGEKLSKAMTNGLRAPT